VRFIGNRSSGKMGVAIAEAFAERGAIVNLILGPSILQTTHPSIKTTNVESAAQMYEAAKNFFDASDIAVLAAAVADYRPKTVADKKIKKKEGDFSIELDRTTDIAASLGKIKRNDQYIVGFALETNNEMNNAMGKLKRKNFDMIVLNSLKDKGAGFKHNTNKVSIIHKDESVQHFELKSKKDVAKDILSELKKIIK